MKNLSFVRPLLLVVLAVCFSAGVVSAEEATDKFISSSETRWRLAVLPPGDYTYKLDTSATPYIVTVTGKEGTVCVIAQGVTESDFSGPSGLIVYEQWWNAIDHRLALGLMRLAVRLSGPRGQGAGQR